MPYDRRVAELLDDANVPGHFRVDERWEAPNVTPHDDECEPAH